MLNCKQATALISIGMDKELTMFQKLSLRFHLMICSGCRNFSKQMDFLRQGLRKLSANRPDTY